MQGNKLQDQRLSSNKNHFVEGLESSKSDGTNIVICLNYGIIEKCSAFLLIFQCS